MKHMPEFRSNIVSSSHYVVDRECMCFTYFMWKKLMEMVDQAQLALPESKKIIPAIVVMWNRCKGRIDKMTRHLDAMCFIFRKGSPKQQLIMREFKKMILSVLFSKKHCFPQEEVPKGKGFTRIQLHLSHETDTMKDVLFTMASTYKIINPTTGIIPGSPM